MIFFIKKATLNPLEENKESFVKKNVKKFVKTCDEHIVRSKDTSH